eukprot:2882576-Rhodomonas_salina.1
MASGPTDVRGQGISPRLPPRIPARPAGVSCLPCICWALPGSRRTPLYGNGSCWHDFLHVKHGVVQ